MGLSVRLHDAKTGKVPEKIEDEIKLLLDGYKSTLAQANMTMDDLVYVQIACTDLAYYDTFNAAYKTYFSKDLPAREFIGAGSLPGDSRAALRPGKRNEKELDKRAQEARRELEAERRRPGTGLWFPTMSFLTSIANERAAIRLFHSG